MANKSNDFDAAMKKLAAEVRQGVVKVRPMTAAQKKAVEAALELPQEAPVPERPKRKTHKQQIERKQRPGHDMDL